MLGRLLGVAALSLVAFAAGAPAQNLAPNAEFDDNIDGWEEVPDAFLAIDWSSVDRTGDATSGSLLGTNSDSSSANLGFYSCVNSISEGESYQYSAFAFVPESQSGLGGVLLALYWWDGLGCSGTQTLEDNSPSAVAGDGWIYLSADPSEAPDGTVSAQLAISIDKGAGGTLAGHFDSVDFRVTLFRDGFESRDRAYWSNSVAEPE